MVVMVRVRVRRPVGDRHGMVRPLDSPRAADIRSPVFLVFLTPKSVKIPLRLLRRHRVGAVQRGQLALSELCTRSSSRYTGRLSLREERGLGDSRSRSFRHHRTLQRFPIVVYLPKQVPTPTHAHRNTNTT